MALSVYKRGDRYWVRGTVGGRQVRCTLDTKNREVAHRRAADMEGAADRGVRSMPWPEFAARFLAHYYGGSRHNLEGLCRRLTDHFMRLNRRYLHEVTLADLEAYIASRRVGNNTLRREIQHLRRIFAHAIDHEICPKNPARLLRMPEEIPAETQPFSRDELARLEAAIERLDEFPELAGRADGAKARLRAQFLVLVHTGIRGSDLVHLRPEHVVDGHLVLRTRKRKTQIRIPLTPPVVAALAAIEPTAAGYYFWTGRGRWTTARANLHRTFLRLAARAGVAHCHPHRFRDTFSVNMLLAGCDIRIVSKLLGHSSLKTTEKHYAPWVQGFQDQAAAAVRKMADQLAPPQPAAPAGNKKGSRKGLPIDHS